MPRKRKQLMQRFGITKDNASAALRAADGDLEEAVARVKRKKPNNSKSSSSSDKKIPSTPTKKTTESNKHTEQTISRRQKSSSSSSSSSFTVSSVKSSSSSNSNSSNSSTFTSFGPGCDACMVNLQGVNEFEISLRHAATQWFRAQLQLSSTTGLMSNELRLYLQSRKSKNKSLKLSSLHALTKLEWQHQISNHLLKIDFTNNVIFNQIFDNKKRKIWLSQQGVHAKYVNNISTIVRFGLNGGGFANQGSASAKSWTSTGFGIWPHIRGLSFIQNVARPAAENVIGKTCGGATGVLFRPPISTLLHEHVDGSMNDMLRRTYEAVDMKDWINRWGYQALLHMKGGHQEARTCVLGPLGITRYRTLLLLIKDHADAPSCSNKLWNNGNGAIDWKVDGQSKSGWELIRPLANRIFTWLASLKESNSFASASSSSSSECPRNDYIWYSNLSKMDQKDLLNCTGEPLEWHPVCPIQKGTSYIARWASGYPHKVEAGKTESRLSIAMTGLGSEVRHNELTCTRCIRHQERLDLLKHAVGDDIELKQSARSRLMLDVVPYAGGGTHVGPQREVGLLDFFGHLYDGF